MIFGLYDNTQVSIEFDGNYYTGSGWTSTPTNISLNASLFKGSTLTGSDGYLDIVSDKPIQFIHLGAGVHPGDTDPDTVAYYVPCFLSTDSEKALFILVNEVQDRNPKILDSTAVSNVSGSSIIPLTY